MKILFDFIPLALFFATFKYAGANKEWAAATATNWLGFMVSGGIVGIKEAPTVLATVVVVFSLIGQIIWLKARREPVQKLLWVGLALAVVFGGATIWFHNTTFIKWKFSIFYWCTAATILFARLIWNKNFPQSVMGTEIDLPTTIWNRLNLAWVVFLVAMGITNIYVAYNFSEDAWYVFKVFISLGLTFVFILAQGVLISRYSTGTPSQEN